MFKHSDASHLLETVEIPEVGELHSLDRFKSRKAKKLSGLDEARQNKLKTLSDQPFDDADSSADIRITGLDTPETYHEDDDHNERTKALKQFMYMNPDIPPQEAYQIAESQMAAYKTAQESGQDLAQMVTDYRAQGLIDENFAPTVFDIFQAGNEATRFAEQDALTHPDTGRDASYKFLTGEQGYFGRELADNKEYTKRMIEGGYAAPGASDRKTYEEQLKAVENAKGEKRGLYATEAGRRVMDAIIETSHAKRKYEGKGTKTTGEMLHYESPEKFQEQVGHALQYQVYRGEQLGLTPGKFYEFRIDKDGVFVKDANGDYIPEEVPPEDVEGVYVGKSKNKINGKEILKLGIASANLKPEYLELWKEKGPEFMARYADKRGENPYKHKYYNKKGEIDPRTGELVVGYDGTPGPYGVDTEAGAMMNVLMRKNAAKHLEKYVHTHAGQVEARAAGSDALLNKEAYEKHDEMFKAGTSEYTLEDAPLWNVHYDMDRVKNITQALKDEPMPSTGREWERVFEHHTKYGDGAYTPGDVVTDPRNAQTLEQVRAWQDLHGEGRVSNLIDGLQYGLGRKAAGIVDWAADGVIRGVKDYYKSNYDLTEDEINKDLADLVRGTIFEKVVDPKTGDFTGVQRWAKPETYGYNNVNSQNAIKKIGNAFDKVNGSEGLLDLGMAVLDGVVTAGPELLTESSGEIVIAGVLGRLGMLLNVGDYNNKILEERAKIEGHVATPEGRVFALASAVGMGLLNKYGAEQLLGKSGLGQTVLGAISKHGTQDMKVNAATLFIQKIAAALAVTGGKALGESGEEALQESLNIIGAMLGTEEQDKIFSSEAGRRVMEAAGGGFAAGATAGAARQPGTTIVEPALSGLSTVSKTVTKPIGWLVDTKNKRDVEKLVEQADSEALSIINESNPTFTATERTAPTDAVFVGLDVLEEQSVDAEDFRDRIEDQKQKVLTSLFTIENNNLVNLNEEARTLYETDKEVFEEKLEALTDWVNSYKEKFSASEILTKESQDILSSVDEVMTTFREDQILVGKERAAEKLKTEIDTKFEELSTEEKVAQIESYITEKILSKNIKLSDEEINDIVSRVENSFRVSGMDLDTGVSVVPTINTLNEAGLKTKDVKDAPQSYKTPITDINTVSNKVLGKIMEQGLNKDTLAFLYQTGNTKFNDRVVKVLSTENTREKNNLVKSLKNTNSRIQTAITNFDPKEAKKLFKEDSDIEGNLMRLAVVGLNTINAAVVSDTEQRNTVESTTDNLVANEYYGSKSNIVTQIGKEYVNSYGLKLQGSDEQVLAQYRKIGNMALKLLSDPKAGLIEESSAPIAFRLGKNVYAKDNQQMSKSKAAKDFSKGEGIDTVTDEKVLLYKDKGIRIADTKHAKTELLEYDSDIGNTIKRLSKIILPGSVSAPTNTPETRIIKRDPDVVPYTKVIGHNEDGTPIIDETKSVESIIEKLREEPFKIKESFIPILLSIKKAREKHGTLAKAINSDDTLRAALSLVPSGSGILELNDRGRVNARLDALNDIVDHLDVFIGEDGKPQEIYFDYQIDVNNRISLIQTVMNFQHDKVFARNLLTKSEGEYVITKKKEKEYFINQVLDELGVKKDSKAHKQLIKFAEKYNNSTDKLKYLGVLTTGKEALRLTGKFRNKTFKLASLLDALNDIEVSNGGNITTSYMVEMDASASGVFNTLINLLGQNVNILKPMLKKLGVTIEGEIDERSDAYTFLSDYVVQELEKNIEETGTENLDLLKELRAIGVDERELAKPAVMTWFYSAGEESIKGNMLEAIVQQVIERAVEGDTNALNHIKRIIGRKNLSANIVKSFKRRGVEHKTLINSYKDLTDVYAKSLATTFEPVTEYKTNIQKLFDVLVKNSTIAGHDFWKGRIRSASKALTKDNAGIRDSDGKLNGITSVYKDKEVDLDYSAQEKFDAGLTDDETDTALLTKNQKLPNQTSLGPLIEQGKDAAQLFAAVASVVFDSRDNLGIMTVHDATYGTPAELFTIQKAYHKSVKDTAIKNDNIEIMLTAMEFTIGNMEMAVKSGKMTPNQVSDAKDKIAELNKTIKETRIENNKAIELKKKLLKNAKVEMFGIDDTDVDVENVSEEQSTKVVEEVQKEGDSAEQQLKDLTEIQKNGYKNSFIYDLETTFHEKNADKLPIQIGYSIDGKPAEYQWVQLVDGDIAASVRLYADSTKGKNIEGYISPEEYEKALKAKKNVISLNAVSDFVNSYEDKVAIGFNNKGFDDVLSGFFGKSIDIRQVFFGKGDWALGRQIDLADLLNIKVENAHRADYDVNTLKQIIDEAISLGIKTETFQDVISKDLQEITDLKHKAGNTIEIDDILDSDQSFGTSTEIEVAMTTFDNSRQTLVDTINLVKALVSVNIADKVFHRTTVKALGKGYIKGLSWGTSLFKTRSDFRLYLRKQTDLSQDARASVEQNYDAIKRTLEAGKAAEAGGVIFMPEFTKGTDPKDLVTQLMHETTHAVTKAFIEATKHTAEVKYLYAAVNKVKTKDVENERLRYALSKEDRDDRVYELLAIYNESQETRDAIINEFNRILHKRSRLETVISNILRKVRDLVQRIMDNETSAEKEFNLADTMTSEKVLAAIELVSKKAFEVQTNNVVTAMSEFGGITKPLANVSAEVNSHASRMLIGYASSAHGLLSPSVEKWHRWAKGKSGIYGEVSNLISTGFGNIEVWDKLKANLFLTGDIDLEKLNKVTTIADTISRRNFEILDTVLPALDKKISKHVKNEKARKQLDILFAKINLGNVIQHSDLENKLIDGESLTDIIKEVEEDATTLDKSIAEKLKDYMMYRKVDRNTQNSKDNKKAALLATLYALNEKDGQLYKMYQTLLKNNKDLFVDLSTLSKTVYTLNQSVQTGVGKTSIGRGSGRVYSGYDEAGTVDVFDTNLEFKVVTLEEYDQERAYEKSVWSVLSAPTKEGTVGIIYRKSPHSFQEGLGVNENRVKNGILLETSYVDNQVKLHGHEWLDSNNVVYDEDNGYPSYRKILTQVEYDNAGGLNNAAHSLWRSYVHHKSLIESQTARKMIMETMVVDEGKEGLAALNNRIKTNNKTKVEDRKEILPFIKTDLSYEELKKKYPQIAKRYKKVENISNYGGFDEEIQYVRIDMADMITGHKQSPFMPDEYPRLQNYERIYKELVQMLKLKLVVASPAKLGVDILSNIGILMTMDVPADEVYRRSKEAISYSSEIGILEGSLVKAKLELSLAEAAKESGKITKYKKQVESIKSKLEAHPYYDAIKHGFIQSMGTQMMIKEFDTITGLQHTIDQVVEKIVKDKKGDPNAIHKAITGWMHAGFGINDILDAATEMATVKGTSFSEELKDISNRLKDKKIKNQEDVVRYVSEFLAAPSSEVVRQGSRVMQLGDATARWSLYISRLKSNLEEKNIKYVDGTTKEFFESVDKLIKSGKLDKKIWENLKEKEGLFALHMFIDYRVNMPKEVKAMSDYGVLMFPSFWMRAQKIIWNLAKYHPLNAGGGYLAADLLNINGASILDANIADKIISGTAVHAGQDVLNLDTLLLGARAF